MGGRGHQRARSLLAPFALDAVDSIERELVQEHLSRCDACLAELTELRAAAQGLDDKQQRPPDRMWDNIARRIGTTDAAPVSVGATGVTTRTRTTPLAALHTDAEVVRITAEATRQLLWVDDELEAVAVVARLIESLGGSVVPADAASDVIPDAMPVDISFGACQPLSPAAPPLSMARLHIEEVLPGVLEDARRTVAQIRSRRRNR